MKRVVFVTVVIFLLALGIVPQLYASGSYVPPAPPRMKGQKASSEEVKKGKELLARKKAFSKKNISCISCHGKKAPQKFKRSKIKKVAPQIEDQIIKCVTEKDRIAGKKIKKSDEKIRQVTAAILSKYKISRASK